MIRLPSMTPPPSALSDMHLTKAQAARIERTVVLGRKGVLLAGGPGSGKSLAMSILSNIPNKVISYAFSASEGLTIQEVRSKMRCFCNTVAPPGVTSCVTADRIDEMSDQHQIILSQAFDSFCRSVRFVVTASAVSRVIPELAARFDHHPMNPPRPRHIRQLVAKCWHGRHELSPSVIDCLIKNTEYSVPRVLSVLDKMYILDAPITPQLVVRSCSTADPSSCESYIRLAQEGRLDKALECLDSVLELGIDPEDVIAGIGEVLEREPRVYPPNVLRSYLKAVLYSFRCNDKLAGLYCLAALLARSGSCGRTDS